MKSGIDQEIQPTKPKERLNPVAVGAAAVGAIVGPIVNYLLFLHNDVFHTGMTTLPWQLQLLSCVPWAIATGVFFAALVADRRFPTRNPLRRTGPIRPAV